DIKETATCRRGGVAILLKLVDDGRVPFRHGSAIRLRNIDSCGRSTFSPRSGAAIKVELTSADIPSAHLAFLAYGCKLVDADTTNMKI
ncbi:MAG: hypothetical protein ACFNPV_07525, partial [Corynebacterium matruchotii]